MFTFWSELVPLILLCLLPRSWHRPRVQGCLLPPWEMAPRCSQPRSAAVPTASPQAGVGCVTHTQHTQHTHIHSKHTTHTKHTRRPICIYAPPLSPALPDNIISKPTAPDPFGPPAPTSAARSPAAWSYLPSAVFLTKKR